MATPTVSERRTKLGALPYVIGGLAFFPLFGVPFGIAAIIWALVTKKTGRFLLGLLGAAGISLTIVLYGGLYFFSFVQHGGIFDHIRTDATRTQLYVVAQAVEFYKLQYGDYPDSLQQLQNTLPKQTLVNVFDMTRFGPGHQLLYLFYRRTGTDKYYLRGVGPDGQPFTADDILPDIKIAPNSKIGILLDAPLH